MIEAPATKDELRTCVLVAARALDLSLEQLDAMEADVSARIDALMAQRDAVSCARDLLRVAALHYGNREVVESGHVEVSL